MTIAKVLDLIKNGERIIAWVKENENSNYALLEDITYPPIDCSKWFEPFTYRDELIEIIPTDESHILLTIFAFDGKRKIWNGPSIVGNIDEGLMLASLPHDVLYDRMEIIEKCTGVKQDKIRAFADVLLANLMEKYGSGKVKSKAAYTAVKIFGGLYHWINKMICLGIILTAFSCSYPTIIDDVPPNPSFVKLEGTLDVSPQINNINIPQINSNELDGNLDESSFDWCYGGFNGSKAKEGTGRISNLKINNDGSLSYKTDVSWWKELGCSSYESADALACLFFKEGNKFYGGKMDWISESRKTRDAKNLHGYNGWDFDRFIKAKEFAFIIVSKNGKTRTNIIYFSK